MSSDERQRILISDSLSDEGLALIEKAGLSYELDPSLDGKALKDKIAGYDALIIRSATNVTKDIIDHAEKLRVIGRAGVGVDNVDVQAATRKGIIVMNTPGGNTISACEHTWALILSLVRNIPRAHNALASGVWDKKRNKGTELFGKTLGIVGLGKIGSEVAHRAAGFGMRIKVYDPYANPELIEELGALASSFDDLVKTSDIITVHVPKNDNTSGMFNSDVFCKMKKDSFLINCARGGIVIEHDLAQALQEGQIKGAAVDVYEKEPTTESPLFGIDNIIHTPHLGASTSEAQERVAIEIVKQVIEFLETSRIINAVNIYGTKADPEVEELSYNLGASCGQLSEKIGRKITISQHESVKPEQEDSIVRAVMNAYLSCFNDGVNFVNALYIAKEKGIEIIKQKKDLDGSRGLISIDIDGEINLCGGISGSGPRLYSLNSYEIDVPIKGNMLLIRNNDVPGVIGFLGTELGKSGINIAFMEVGRLTEGGTALTIMGVDQDVDPLVLKAISRDSRIEKIESISL